MPRLKPLTLTDDGRSKLEAWARRPKSARRPAPRPRTALAAARGLTNAATAAEPRVTLPAVGKWRGRFLGRRLGGPTDGPRPGPPRAAADARVEDAVTRTLGPKPADAPHRSARGMAKAAGLSRTAAVRAWRAFGREPRLRGTFKLSTGPHPVEKVRDVAGLYLSPPERAVVLCVGEKPGAQALGRAPPALPLAAGQAGRGTRDHVRHGTAPLFAALDVATGKVIGACHRRQRGQEPARLLADIDAAVPHQEGVTVHLVMDDSAPPKAPAVRRWPQRRPRLVAPFTPTGASWLSQVERVFAEITDRRIRRGVSKSVTALGAAIGAYLAERNAAPKPPRWTATADLILRRVEAVCKRTCDSGH